MPVETRAPHLSAKLAQWARVRDAVGGSDAVRANPTAYVPMLSGQTSEEYAAYINRPAFFEATGRTRDAMTGLVFARAPTVAIPPALEFMLSDVDADGSTLQEFAAHVVDELQETGFGAVVVSHNGDPERPGTAANPSGRALLTWYPAESILDYKHATANGSRMLSQLRLLETATVEGASEFDATEVLEIVVHDLEASTDGPRYRIRRYQETKPDKSNRNAPKWVQVGASQYGVISGKPMDYVPARIVTTSNRRMPGNAPLAPLAEMNLSHWRTSADYEHALHFCGLPTPYVTGVTLGGKSRGDVASALDDGTAVTSRRPAKADKFRLGSTSLHVFDNPAAQMRYLTLDTAGIGALKDALTDKAGNMAVLGARMLAAENGPAESGVALSVKRSGESSALVRIADTASAAISEALSIAAEMSDLGDVEVTFALDTSFATSALDATTITALLSAVNAGKLSRRSFLEKLKAGGFIADARQVDDELEEIENDPASFDPLAAFGGPAPGPPGNDDETTTP